MSEYQHLNLRGWPFNVVPSDASASVWVGRPAFKRELDMVLRSARRVESSRIVLLWADYGAGKTHALRHLAWMAKKSKDVRALYVVTPKGVKSFLDVYRAVMDSALVEGLLEEVGLALHRRLGPAGGTTDLQRALVRFVAFEEPAARPVLGWLRAEKVLQRELRDVSLSRRLETSSDGIDTLNEFIALVRSELSVRVILLMDEIQELGELDRRRLDEAVGGLHKVFDHNTAGLTMLLSFTTASQKTVARIIGQTLFERRAETLTLPALAHPEAAPFITELIAAWSIDGTRVPFPFNAEAVQAVADAIETNLGADRLTPREVIRGFDTILRQADVDIEDGVIACIETSYALALLGERLGEEERD